jgi:isopenicillin-N N-acyltransferase like protein
LISANDAFPELRLHGSPREIGWQHGEQLREQIACTLDYYRCIFGLGEAQLKERAEAFARIIGDFEPAFAQEIEAIAEAANLDSRFIYALNSRSEILNNISIAECTAVASSAGKILAQNWDWSEALEELVVLITIEPQQGPRILTLTEPGIIGKIGMNSAGLGVCLNILKSERRLLGLPVHVLLRAILHCETIAQVRELVGRVCVGKASHILVADAMGESLSMEFCAEETLEIEPEDGVLLHTNHYLGRESLNTEEAFPSTRERHARAIQILRGGASQERIEEVLADQTQAEMSICRPYSPSDTPGFGNVGSVFTVIMALQERQMVVRRGPRPDAGFRQFRL